MPTYAIMSVFLLVVCLTTAMNEISIGHFNLALYLGWGAVICLVAFIAIALFAPEEENR